MRKVHYLAIFLVCVIGSMFFGLDKVDALKSYQTYCEYEGTIARTDKLDNNGNQIEEPIKFRILMDFGSGITYQYWAQKYTIDTFEKIDPAYFDLGGTFYQAISSAVMNSSGNDIAIYCPKKLRISGYGVNGPEMKEIQFNLNYSSESDYNLYNNKLIKEAVAEKIIVDDSTGELQGTEGDTQHSIDPNEKEQKVTGCDIFGSATSDLLKTIILTIRILVPILIVILGIVDLVGVTLSGEEKKFQEVWNRFIKRLLAGLLIIFVPSILNLLIDFSGVLEQYNITEVFCGF